MFRLSHSDNIAANNYLGHFRAVSKNYTFKDVINNDFIFTKKIITIDPIIKHINKYNIFKNYEVQPFNLLSR